MTKSTFAKIFGWIGGAATVLGQSGFDIGHFHGHGFLSIIGPILLALGVHQSSNTSAANPNGQQ